MSIDSRIWILLRSKLIDWHRSTLQTIFQIQGRILQHSSKLSASRMGMASLCWVFSVGGCNFCWCIFWKTNLGCSCPTIDVLLFVWEGCSSWSSPGVLKRQNSFNSTRCHSWQPGNLSLTDVHFYVKKYQAGQPCQFGCWNAGTTYAAWRSRCFHQSQLEGWSHDEVAARPSQGVRQFRALLARESNSIHMASSQWILHYTLSIYEHWNAQKVSWMYPRGPDVLPYPRVFNLPCCMFSRLSVVLWDLVLRVCRVLS